MKQVMQFIGIVLLFLIFIVGMGWMIEGNDFVLYRHFAPKQEAVRRQVFEQTKSYNQGMIQELQNFQFEYIKADKEHKPALAGIILHRAADFDESKLPSDLREFIAGLRRERSM